MEQVGIESATETPHHQSSHDQRHAEIEIPAQECLELASLCLLIPEYERRPLCFQWSQNPPQSPVAAPSSTEHGGEL